MTNPQRLSPLSDTKGPSLTYPHTHRTGIPIFAFAGRAGSGKDTAAKALLSVGCAELSFAKPIRDSMQTIFGINIYDDAEAAKKNDVIPWLGVSPRHIMQTLGTEWGRELIHENLWVLLMERSYLRVVESRLANIAVVTDYRFPNEGDWLRRVNATIIHIRRPGAAIALSGHVSEQVLEVKPGEYVIDNDGTVEELHAKVRHIYDLQMTVKRHQDYPENLLAGYRVMQADD